MNDIEEILLPTAYFGSVSYFAAIINNSSRIIIETKETYQKQTLRNRCNILTANGILNLTIPVQKPNGNHTRTEDITIFNNKWYLMHWRAIESAYSASPYFLFYKDELLDIFNDASKNLLDINMNSLVCILKIIGITPDIRLSESFKKPGSFTGKVITDLRYSSITDIFPNLIFPSYTQVFSDRFGFIPDLSILDLLFNLGPETLDYLKEVAASLPTTRI